MKLRLKEKELAPVQLRLVVPGALKAALEQYVKFVREKSEREVEMRGIAIEILAQFMESDREFKQWQKSGQTTGLLRKQGGGKADGQVNGQVSA
jgi:hypothetical protein